MILSLIGHITEQIFPFKLIFKTVAGPQTAAPLSYHRCLHISLLFLVRSFFKLSGNEDKHKNSDEFIFFQQLTR